MSIVWREMGQSLSELGLIPPLGQVASNDLPHREPGTGNLSLAAGWLVGEVDARALAHAEGFFQEVLNHLREGAAAPTGGSLDLLANPRPEPNRAGG